MPADRRPPHRRHRLLQQRVGHLPPRADRRHRDPRVGRRTGSWWRPRCSWAASPRAPSRRRRPTSRCSRRSMDWLLANSGDRAQVATPTARSARSSTASPSASCSTPNAPASRTIIDRIVYMTGDDEIAVHTRSGPGYVALSIAFSRAALLVQDRGGPAPGARRGLRAHLVQHLRGPGRGQPAALLLRRRRGSSTPWTRTRRASITAGPRHHLGGPRRSRRWRPRSASARAAGSSTRYIRRESRSGLYRESTPPEEVPQDIQHLESLEGRLEVRVLPRSAETVDAQALLGAARSPSPTPCARCRTWA